MHRTPRPRSDHDTSSSPAETDRRTREREAAEERGRRQDAAGQDAESGRNGGRESDETRQST